MINKLRKRFIAVAMISVFIVLAVLIGSINILNYYNIIKDADRTIDMIADNGGEMPGGPGGAPDGEKPDGLPGGEHGAMERPFDTRYFTAYADSSGNIVSVDLERVAAVAEDSAKEYAGEVVESGKDRGFIDNYRFLKQETGNGSMVVFLDCYRSLGNFRTFLIYSLAASLIGLISVFILVLILSRRMVKPVAESYDKQKRFITDAGHELKTPLSVIDADISVMEMDGNGSEWTDDIKLQSGRLKKLTEELVYLSRMDEARKTTKIEFPVSDIVSEEAGSFISRAKVEGKDLELDIEKGLSYTGDEGEIKELTSILLDNAIKYSDDNGTIKVSLKRDGKGVTLSVYNTAESVDKESCPQMFDRFYRGDPARSEEIKGYGLGLSIAEAITAHHNGSIKAFTESGKDITIEAKLR